MNGLSGEDRARLELLAEVCGQYIGGACRRALALIDQQEKEIERLRRLPSEGRPDGFGGKL